MSWAAGAWALGAWELTPMLSANCCAVTSTWEGLEGGGSIVVYVSGQQAVISLGGVSVAATASTALVGLSSVSFLGSVVPAASSLTEISGVAKSLSVGVTSSTAGSSVNVVGVDGVGITGTLSIVGDAFTDVTGTATAFITGSITTAQIYAVSGVSSASGAGGVAITGEALTQLTGQSSDGIVGVLSISADGTLVVTGVDAATFFGSVDVIESFTFDATGFELVSSSGVSNVDTTTFTFNPALYAPKRSVLVEGRVDRTVFVEDVSRTVSVDKAPPVVSGSYADVKPRIVFVEEQNRVLYVGKAKR